MAVTRQLTTGLSVQQKQCETTRSAHRFTNADDSAKEAKYRKRRHD